MRVGVKWESVGMTRYLLHYGGQKFETNDGTILDDITGEDGLVSGR